MTKSIGGARPVVWKKCDFQKKDELTFHRFFTLEYSSGQKKWKTVESSLFYGIELEHSFGNACT